MRADKGPERERDDDLGRTGSPPSAAEGHGQNSRRLPRSGHSSPVAVVYVDARPRRRPAHGARRALRCARRAGALPRRAQCTEQRRRETDRGLRAPPAPAGRRPHATARLRSRRILPPSTRRSSRWSRPRRWTSRCSPETSCASSRTNAKASCANSTARSAICSDDRIWRPPPIRSRRRRSSRRSPMRCTASPAISASSSTILKELNQTSLGDINEIYADLNRHLDSLKVVPKQRAAIVNRSGGAAERGAACQRRQRSQGPYRRGGAAQRRRHRPDGGAAAAGQFGDAARVDGRCRRWPACRRRAVRGPGLGICCGRLCAERPGAGRQRRRWRVRMPRAA